MKRHLLKPYQAGDKYVFQTIQSFFYGNSPLLFGDSCKSETKIPSNDIFKVTATLKKKKWTGGTSTSVTVLRFKDSNQMNYLFEKMMERFQGPPPVGSKATMDIRISKLNTDAKTKTEQEVASWTYTGPKKDKVSFPLPPIAEIPAQQHKLKNPSWSFGPCKPPSQPIHGPAFWGSVFSKHKISSEPSILQTMIQTMIGTIQISGKHLFSKTVGEVLKLDHPSRIEEAISELEQKAVKEEENHSTFIDSIKEQNENTKDLVGDIVKLDQTLKEDSKQLEQVITTTKLKTENLLLQKELEEKKQQLLEAIKFLEQAEKKIRAQKKQIEELEEKNNKRVF